MARSGPAAGVSASASLARSFDLPRVLTFDMGGTTTDVCLIVDGVAEMTDTCTIGGRPLRQPMLAVHSIGAGGGSIVHLGPGGLSVKPHSAGSEPGPACYDRGGTRATITDANALLGHLEPAARLGDTIQLDLDAAAAVIAPIADALGKPLIETALGIVQVANAAMARALRRATVERGVDGRDCALLAFGGGGPMHAVGLAEIYGLAEIIVPTASSAFSALGCLTADYSFLQQQTVRYRLDYLAPEVFADRMQDLVTQVTRPLVANGIAPEEIVLEHMALVRNAAKSDATPIPFTTPFNPTALSNDFAQRHRALYGYSTDEPLVIESLRLQARKPTAPRNIKSVAGLARAAARRVCHFPGTAGVQTAVLDRGSLTGITAGPVIICDAWSTVVVPPGWQARPDDMGNLFPTRHPA